MRLCPFIRLRPGLSSSAKPPCKVINLPLQIPVFAFLRGLVTLIALSPMSALMAQEANKLTVIVRDEHARPIAGANCSLYTLYDLHKALATGTTDENGATVILVQMPRGRSLLLVQASGFDEVKRQLDSPTEPLTTIKIAMKVATVSAEITV